MRRKYTRLYQPLRTGNEGNFDAKQSHKRKHQRIGQRHPHHSSIRKTYEWREGRGQQEQESGLSVWRRHRRQVGAGINGHRQKLELDGVDNAFLHRGFGFVDVDRADKNVVGDGRQQAVEQIEERQLGVGRRLEYKSNNRGEQVLVDNHRHHRKEDRQQCGKRQGFGKGFTDRMLVRYPAKGRRKNND